MRTYTILVVKESNPGEMRVSLIPNDVAKLIAEGHQVVIESDAGMGAGFANDDYIAAGASIRVPNDDFSNLFDDIDIIIRAKRPNKMREAVEATLFKPGMIMIGALDPFEQGSTHTEDYKKAGLITFSLDQLDVPADSDLNILASMSQIAGKLAVQDALQKSKRDSVNEAVVIGAGVAGLAAIDEALAQGLSVTAILSSDKQAAFLESKHVRVIIIERTAPLETQQQRILNELRSADIVITAARRAGERAPILIPASSLDAMTAGACIVDLSLSEGGNVEGSEHDKTHRLGNDVIVTNVSGYPKAVPQEASEKWSKASLAFIHRLDHYLAEPKKLEKTVA